MTTLKHLREATKFLPDETHIYAESGRICLYTDGESDMPHANLVVYAIDNGVVNEPQPKN